MHLSKQFITSVSINEAAVKNGADLVKKKSFMKLAIDPDQTILFGECAGSGKNPYHCSADFIEESAPVFRCSCPSRQIPCKHVIGLMWAYATGHKFLTEAVPEDITVKRSNKEKRVARAKEKAQNPESGESKEKSAAWKRSAVKKIEAQLTGIAEAEKIMTGITAAGLASLDAKNIREYEAVVRQLDSYFIPGIQNEITDLLNLAHGENTGGSKNLTHYQPMVEKLCRITTLLDKAKAYLTNKKAAPDQPDTESEIEELIGYAWKLEELARYGLLETDALLIQLMFHVRQEKKQFVEEAYYISLPTGQIVKTRNYRPFKAAKYIKEEDTVHGVLRLPRLYRYPSLSLNPRVRWEDNTMTDYADIMPADCGLIKSHAHTDFTLLIKTVKNQLKNLLLSPHPVALVRFAEIFAVENTGEALPQRFVITDSAGHTLDLRKSDYCQDSFLFLLDRLTPGEAKDQAMLLLFDNHADTGELTAQPLALITNDRIIRLVY